MLVGLPSALLLAAAIERAVPGALVGLALGREARRLVLRAGLAGAALALAAPSALALLGLGLAQVLLAREAALDQLIAQTSLMAAPWWRKRITTRRRRAVVPIAGEHTGYKGNAVTGARGRRAGQRRAVPGRRVHGRSAPGIGHSVTDDQ